MASEKDNGSGSATTPETPKGKPTDKQMNLLAIIMQNVEDQPKINWENVAVQAGLKNDRVAKESYRQICKKFGWNKGGSAATTPGGTGETPTKVTKRTGKVGSARKPRAKKETAAVAAQAAADEYEDDELGLDDKSKVKEEAAYENDPFMSGAI
ncbi:hypothetical protein VPNG_04724 [Cytospora leucostoma]|uniref:Myb-like domain-containing protein n=1 Tax=Cytospora leucostoma TaxID=1230097 RepID=A0A423XAE0_9PEZI|nr:hypothetical protein VPNG_04724 [Cytospora leucostoma]